MSIASDGRTDRGISLKAVIQRVSEASVTVAGEVVGAIGAGLMILVGVHEQDTTADADYLARKIAQMRIFEDEEEKMNLDIQQIQGQILSISQFTLYANTKKGNRPSFAEAAKPEPATELYQYFNEQLRKCDLFVAEGVFGAMMEVALVNDGPVTIVLDSRSK